METRISSAVNTKVNESNNRLRAELTSVISAAVNQAEQRIYANIHARHTHLIRMYHVQVVLTMHVLTPRRGDRQRLQLVS